MPMSFGGVSKQKVATVIVAADGTGDTTDIQIGINLLPATGGVVYVKDGTWTITASLTFPNDNIAIFGSGHSTIIYTTSNIPLFNITTDYSSIRDIYIKGNSTGASQHGIYLNGAAKSFIHNCWIDHLGGNGIFIEGVTNWNTISENYILLCKENGIYMHADGVYQSSTIIVSNHINAMVKNGIYLHGKNVGGFVNQCTISNNWIFEPDLDHAATYSGIALGTTTNGSVDENSINGNQCLYANKYGIDIRDVGVVKTVVMSNTCLHNTAGQINDAGTDTLPNGAVGTNNLELDDLNYV